MDYCTGFWEGNWAHCCKAHDVAYSFAKLQADLDLASCVAASTWDVIAWVMFAGVSLLGWMFYKKGDKHVEGDVGRADGGVGGNSRWDRPERNSATDLLGQHRCGGEDSGGPEESGGRSSGKVYERPEELRSGGDKPAP